MIIKNANVYTPAHIFASGHIVIRNGRIADAAPVALPGEEVIDAKGAFAIPGLVDIHFHGAMGHDFCDADPQGLQAILDYEASQGVLACCPATMTYSEDILGGICDTAAAHVNGKGADLVGINMEGPFISHHRLGAQNPAYVMPADIGMFRRLQKRSGNLIKLLDIAPETRGCLDFIRACRDEVRVSVAHTCADYETAKEAFQNGATHITHLYNAMPDISHRAPGPVIAAWEEGAEAELINDGIHIHDAIARFTYALFTDSRVIQISDSMMATGLPGGQYTLGGQDVTVSGNRAVLTDRPDTVAGSVTSLYGCLRHSILISGIAPESAIRACTENPAVSIGIDGDYGSLSVGRWGNVLLADGDWNPVKVIQKGQVIRE